MLDSCPDTVCIQVPHRREFCENTARMRVSCGTLPLSSIRGGIPAVKAHLDTWLNVASSPKHERNSTGCVREAR